MGAFLTTSHSSSEDQIRNMIQLQKQELKRLNDQIQRLTQLYDAEREQRKLLARKCRELEDIMKKEGIESSNHPSAIASASSQDSEHAARGLEYRQHREALNLHQQNQYYGPSGYQYDQHAVYRFGAAPSASQYNVTAVPPPQHLQQYPQAVPHQQNFSATYEDQYSTEANKNAFVGGFRLGQNRF